MVCNQENNSEGCNQHKLKTVTEAVLTKDDLLCISVFSQIKLAPTQARSSLSTTTVSSSSSSTSILFWATCVNKNKLHQHKMIQ